MLRRAAFPPPGRRLRACLLLCLGAIVITACNRAKSVNPTELRGVSLPKPLARPAFVLTNTDGTLYNFRTQTAGKLTFLFFGYTYCPDVCPVHMANLAAILNTLKYNERQRINVVFVTADPARDSIPRLRSWLDTFDPKFVGLWGSEAQVDSVQMSLDLGAPIRYPKQPDGSYSVGHAGQVIVFGEDDTARVVYPFGTRQSDWANDIPLLLNPHKR